MAISWQSPNKEQAETGVVPDSILLTIYAAPALPEAPAGMPGGINPAMRLFSSGAAPALHSLFSPVMHCDR
jgi:hypothetical protein